MLNVMQITVIMGWSMLPFTFPTTPMNNNDKPELTPEELQVLEASRRLQAFTDQVMRECFPSLFNPKKEFDALPNKEEGTK
jgi:hypothetical protein